MSLAEQLASALREGLSPEQAAQLADALRSDKPSAESKATKLEANYREADSDRSRCGTCSHLIASDSGSDACDLVAGPIDRDYVCDWFEAGETGSAPDPGGSDNGSRRRDSLGD